MNKQDWTRIVVLLTPIIWIAYDLFAYFHWGNAYTESAYIFRWAYYCPGIAFLFGLLCGHFFFQMHEPTEYPTTCDEENINSKPRMR